MEYRGVGRKTTDLGEAGGMRQPGGAAGMTGHGGDEGAWSQGRAYGSEGRDRIIVSKAGCRDWGSSNPGVAGDRKSQRTTDPPDMAC